MRIVIVGDGKVGYTLTERLASEGHDLVVIDNNPRNLSALSSALDVITVLGNGASYSVQQEAGVADADLLVAVTSMDEINMICCLLAKKLGAKHTIARVRNPDYAAQLVLLKEELGLSMAVNPEQSAATEIARLLRYPSAAQIETFARGRVELVEYRVPERSVLDGMALSKIAATLKVHVLVCAVQRGDAVHIPAGNFVLKAGDHIHFTSPPAETEAFFRKLDAVQHHTRDIMMVGGGRVAYYLARQMLELGVSVKIIENNPSRAEELSEALPRAMIIHGDGTDPDLLSEEGLETAGAFAALTGIDEENIILSLYAKTRTRGKVITKVDRLAFLGVLDDIGLDSLISPKAITANSIVSYVRGMQNSLGSNVETLHRLMGGRIEALEFRIRDTANYLGLRIRELPLRPKLLIGCIVRKGATIIPTGNDTIEKGDAVIVITDSPYCKDYNDIFTHRAKH